HTGFIPATEGDDWSDAEADYADTGGKGPAKSQRKNRRGQRERRAIWEKKYGRHANHLKLREKERRKAREHRVPDRPTK
ncbi:BUD22 family protein, partial [Escherichia coli]|uniref:BUD22 family protein n=1 Tax=Escherichia coli TaxID=562 RepID=UPI00398B1D08